MTTHRSHYIIAYDIPDDKRRLKIATLLEGYGERVQYSLFECLLTEPQFAALWKELNRLILPTEDSLRIYQLCPPCSRRIRTIGQATDVDLPPVYIV